MGKIIIYQQKKGKAVDVRLEGGTVWLTQLQMAEIFEASPNNIGLHINNIYKSHELAKSATTKESLVVQIEGNRQISRKIKHYNLDMIISVAYRVNSKRGIHFRQWATRVLNDYLTNGYSINRQRLERNAQELEAALKLVQQTAQVANLTTDIGRGLVDVISRYMQTFLLLQRYDEGLLVEPIGTSGGELPTIKEVRHILKTLKKDLMERGEVGDLFAHERSDALESILGNLEQSAFGEPAYPTLESKAAHLLYFVIKDRPLSDGNKRCGACLFADFLHRNKALIRNGQPIINDTGLAALALLVAESAATQKEIIIRLIMNMLSPIPMRKDGT